MWQTEYYVTNWMLCDKLNTIWQTEYYVTNFILCNKLNTMWQTAYYVTNWILCDKLNTMCQTAYSMLPSWRIWFSTKEQLTSIASSQHLYIYLKRSWTPQARFQQNRRWFNFLIGFSLSQRLGIFMWYLWKLIYLDVISSAGLNIQQHNNVLPVAKGWGKQVRYTQSYKFEHF